MITEGGGNFFGDSPVVLPDIFQNMQYSIVTGGSSSSNITSVAQSNPATIGTQAVGNPTNTETKSAVFTGSAVGSVALNSGFGFNQTGGTDGIAIAANMIKSGCRVKVNNPASVRWLIGLIDNDNNVLADNPNTTFVGFRFSSGVDTNWTLYAGTTNVLFTAVDSGIPVDTTASHTFELNFVPGAGSGALTAVQFIYDGKIINTITTNLPALSTTLNNSAWGNNKNVGNATVLGFFWQYMLMRR